MDRITAEHLLNLSRAKMSAVRTAIPPENYSIPKSVTWLRERLLEARSSKEAHRYKDEYLSSHGVYAGVPDDLWEKLEKWRG